jgi:hypothetical protein
LRRSRSQVAAMIAGILFNYGILVIILGVVMTLTGALMGGRVA